jgi:hypothetical protein
MAAQLKLDFSSLEIKEKPMHKLAAKKYHLS